ncbi:MobQ family relaxase [Gluconacetobacter entanii]|uniref:Conjugal transfer protein TraA n=1 Tax=Gluconacetobacter entanii TaxID=108528 RepID=A0A318Q7U2_9PROT|nr:MobQ family relaxase [Gluconacetobacter entanii]PYD60714.1 conjugal transfer protein TraA [Gluconacetobacter entanii]
MAIFHLSVKTVSRSTGRSAVAAAAYRTGDRLTNERDGRHHDYTRRSGVDGSFIMAPTGCDWALDRSRLWNTAEQTEKRSNSVTAREYVLALPAELDATERSDLARAFAGALVERYGVAADVALHAPSREGDERNHHAHILTTTREVEPDGLGKKTRILDAAKTGWPEIESLRELWAMQCNEALERHNKPARVDHRSYERQGVEKMPTLHLGPTSVTIERKHQAEAERKGEDYQPRTFKAQENRRRRGLNERVRELAQELAGVIRQVRSAKIAAARSLVRAFGRKRRAEQEAEAKRAEMLRQQEAEQRQAEEQQEEASRKALKRQAQQEQRIESRLAELISEAPEKRATLFARFYPTDPLARAVDAKLYRMELEDLEAEEKAVRTELEQYEAQERQEQSEGPGMRVKGRGRGRGGPSRSSGRDTDPDPSGGGSGSDPF